MKRALIIMGVGATFFVGAFGLDYYLVSQPDYCCGANIGLGLVSLVGIAIFGSGLTGLIILSVKKLIKR